MSAAERQEGRTDSGPVLLHTFSFLGPKWAGAGGKTTKTCIKGRGVELAITLDKRPVRCHCNIVSVSLCSLAFMCPKPYTALPCTWITACSANSANTSTNLCFSQCIKTLLTQCANRQRRSNHSVACSCSHTIATTERDCSCHAQADPTTPRTETAAGTVQT